MTVPHWSITAEDEGLVTFLRMDLQVQAGIVFALSLVFILTFVLIVHNVYEFQWTLKNFTFIKCKLCDPGNLTLQLLVCSYCGLVCFVCQFNTFGGDYVQLNFFWPLFWMITWECTPSCRLVRFLLSINFIVRQSCCHNYDKVFFSHNALVYQFFFRFVFAAYWPIPHNWP